MTCTDRGEGPTVLLLHGNPDTRALWDPVVDRCHAHRRCVAPDLPGFGEAPVPDGFDFSLDAMAGWVDDIVNGLDPDKQVTLAVHDFGGIYGLAWAVRHPHRVRAMLITNTLFFSDYRWHRWARIWRTPGLGELSMRFMNYRLFRRELRRGSRRLDDTHIEAMYAHRSATMDRTVLAMYRATRPRNFAGWEEKMVALGNSVPTRVVWGRQDPYIPHRYAMRFGTRDVRVLDGVGHWMPAEAPDVVAEALLDLH